MRRSGDVGYVIAVGLLAATLFLLAAAQAGANHQGGNYYSGTQAQGGRLNFSMSSDGSTLSDFGWNDLWGTSPTGGWCNSSQSTSFFYGAPPVTDHAFNYSGSDFDATGSFPSAGTASGTVTLHTPPDGGRLQCTSSQLNWTAATGSASVGPPTPTPAPTQPFTFPNGATYKGSHEQGRSLEFDVAVDGSRIMFIRFGEIDGTSPQTGTCSFTNNGQNWQAGEGPVINGGAWDYSSTDSFGDTLTFKGSFGGGPTASGTIGAHFTQNECTIGPVNWTATSGPPPPSPGGDGGGSSGGGSADTTPPELKIGGDSAQAASRSGSIAVTVSCPTEPCDVIVSGTVAVPKLAKVYKFKTAFKELRKGTKARFVLKLSKAGRRAVKRALRRHVKLKAKVTVVATDGAFNKTTRKRTIKLR